MLASQVNNATPIHTLDLNFMGIQGAIATYLIPHARGGLLIESGPGSTLPALEAALQAHGLQPSDISDVFLTHIHLDHAGAAGWLAQRGARVHVHPVGAPHMIDPDRLLASAARIYGEMMGALWGEFLPVPEERLSVLQDGDQVEVEGHLITAVNTPGHANHHYAYLFEEVCFSGDIGGVRLPGPRHLRLPMPPPDFNIEKWRSSLDRLRQAGFARIAPTHFGIYSDPQWHLDAIAKGLDEVEDWMERTLPADPPIEEINEQFLEWSRQRSREDGLEEAHLQVYETANPSWMAGYGMQRYWKKFRSAEQISGK